jgi:hypothetical protein
MPSHEITLFLHSETDKAWMVNESPLHGKPPTPHIWLPKSQCTEVRRSSVPHPNAGKGVVAPGAKLGTNITLDVPEWLIAKNDLEDLVA